MQQQCTAVLPLTLDCVVGTAHGTRTCGQHGCAYLPVMPVTPSSNTLSSELPGFLLAAAVTALVGWTACTCGAGDTALAAAGLAPAALLDPETKDCILCMELP